MPQIVARTTKSLDKSRALFTEIAQYVAGGQRHYNRLTAGPATRCHPGHEHAGDLHAPNAVPSSAGTPQAAADLVVPLPWNCLDVLERTLEERGHEIAAILTEPVMCNCGVIPPEPGYLEGLRELTA